MDWIKTIEDAMEYIEENITEDLTVSRIASLRRLPDFMEVRRLM